MSVPTAALQRECRAYLVTGHVWNPRVDDSDPNEGAEGVIVRVDFPQLGMLWAGGSRTVSLGNSYNADGTPAGGGSATVTHATAGLYRESFTVGGTTAYRWCRTVDRPATGAANEPIVDEGWQIDRHFVMRGWQEQLTNGGWGGATLDVEVFDPDNTLAGTFVEGRAIALYVEEWEDGVLTSTGEAFSGFVLAVETSATVEHPAYAVRCGTIEQLLGRDGMDGHYSWFINSDFLGDGVYGPVNDPLVTQTGLLAAQPAHVVSGLTVGYALYHVLRWHLKATVDGTDYPISSLVDFVRDYWNDIPAADSAVLALNLPPGNLLRTLASWLPEGVWRAYSFRTSSLVVTPEHELKATADALVGTITLNNVYGVTEYPQTTQRVRQVWVARTPQSLEAFDKMSDAELLTMLVMHPDPSASVGGLLDRSRTPYWVVSVAAAQKVAKALYDIANSQTRVVLRLPGMTFGLFNKLSYQGSAYVVESVTLSLGTRMAGEGLETEVWARKIVIS